MNDKEQAQEYLNNIKDNTFDRDTIIEWLNMNYYRIDGYGNARDIEIEDLEYWLQDIVNGDFE